MAGITFSIAFQMLVAGQISHAHDIFNWNIHEIRIKVVPRFHHHERLKTRRWLYLYNWLSSTYAYDEWRIKQMKSCEWKGKWLKRDKSINDSREGWLDSAKEIHSAWRETAMKQRKFHMHFLFYRSWNEMFLLEISYEKPFSDVILVSSWKTSSMSQAM